MKRLSLHLVLGAVVVLASAGGVRALEPDEILLLTNKNIRESAPLAHFYAKARNIPDGRILELALPIFEEIAFVNYEQQVVPQVRQFLKDNNLDKKVKCIVTFFGVPLRIGPHLLAEAQREELAALKTGRDKLVTELAREITELEKKVAAENPAFRPQTGNDINQLAARAEAVFRAMAQRAAQIQDPAARQQQVKSMMEAMNRLGGAASVMRLFAQGQRPPEEEGQLKEMAAKMQAMANEVGELQHLRHDPQARIRMRRLIADGFGRIELLRVMQLHIDYLEPADSGAAFDNELALLWWDFYGRTKWQPNMLHYRNQNRQVGAPPMLMVMRLDAAEAGQVRDMVLAGLRAERDGLKGKMVIDSRSIYPKGEGPVEGGYGWYDQTLRNLAEIIKTRSKLPLLHEDSPELLGARSTGDIALYCGWYSVRNYIPPGKFNTGAVGFHVASFEMISLRADNERGWVKNLIADGVCATLGPVNEPYLHAFPPADEFFPLLMTGKLTLAEVYWKSNMLTSWQINMVGDPFYTPFKTNPAMRVEDLPERLKLAFEEPATRPASPSTRPATQPVGR